VRPLVRNLVTAALFLGFEIVGLGQSVALSIGSASGTAGATVSLPINLTSSGGPQTAGLQWSFAYSADITGVTVVAGPSAINAGKSITCLGNNCLLLGFNNTAMSDGTVATATFQVASNPSTTSILVQITGVVASTAAGDSIPASGGSGTISLPAPPPVVKVVLNPLNASLAASQSKQFTATVTGSANTSVTWSMTPLIGTLSNGLYTAPSVISSGQSVTVTATSVADPTKSASATVQLNPPGTVSVGVNPPSANLTPSQSTQFTATVTGSANTSVTWSMTPSLGSLSNGSYTAPSVINSAQSVTITATSVADPTKSASATVQIAPSGSTPPGSDGINITSPTNQPTFVSSQNTISLAGTATADATQVVWATDQGLQGQAGGTANWSANGIALRTGSNRITVTARNSTGNLSSVAITVFFNTASIITSLPDAQLGKPYSSKLAALGGTPPFTWSGESMPHGLTVNKDGTISGTPDTAGTFTLNITLLDSLQIVVTAAVKLRIDNGLVLLSAASLKSGPVAPDSMVTVFGAQLAAGAQSATQSPLPTTLGDCAVTITDANGVPRPAGLYYVSPDQINFEVPADTAAGSATITVTSKGQTQIFGSLTIAPLSPGLFFLNPDGLAAADLARVKGNITTHEAIAQLDTTTDLFVPIPIDLGSDTDQVYLTLYGTGIRHRPSLDSVQVLVANLPAVVDYAGASTTSDGLDLVHVLLPNVLRGTGTANIVVTVNGLSSNVVTVVIK